MAGGDTAKAFTIDDIKQITVNGQIYKAADLDTDSSKPVYIDSDGNIIINMKMGNGYSKDGFKIELENDYISELDDEKLNVQLIGTKGGELNLGEDPNNPGDYIVVTPGNGPGVSTTVKDHRDGPELSLQRVDTAGVEGDSLSVQVNMTKDGQPASAISDTTITLKLGADVADNVVDGGRAIKVTGPNGFETTATLHPDGRVTFEVPTGQAGPFKVEFPLQDNARESANQDFKVSMDESCLTTGETTLAGNKEYSGVFDGETNTTQTFILSGPGSVAADGKCVISLNGAEHVDKITFVLDGQQYTISGDQFVNGKYEIPGKIGSSLNGVKVTVTFKDGLTDDQLADAKLNTSVSGSLSGMELTIPVADDPLAWDGPTFTVGADVASTTDAAISSASFTIGVGGYSTQFNETQEAIVITFQLTGDFASKAGSLTASYGVLAGPVDGMYTLTLPKDTNLDNLSGGIKITATVSGGADKVVAGDHGLGLKITDVVGGEAGGEGAAGSMVIKDTSRPDFEIVAPGAAVPENGGEAVFTLTGGAGISGTTQEVTTLSFKLAGSHAEGAEVYFGNTKLTADGNGVYTVTVPKNTTVNANMGQIKVKLSADDQDNGGNIKLTDVTVKYGSEAAKGLGDLEALVTEAAYQLKLVPDASTVAEGGNLSFTLNLLDGATAIAATEALVVTFLVTGFAPAGADAATIGGAHSDLGQLGGNGAVWTWSDQHQGYIVTATIPAGSSSATVSAQALADGIIENNEGVSFKVIDISDSLAENNVNLVDSSNAPLVTGSEVQYVITDGDSANVPAGLEAQLNADAQDLLGNDVDVDVDLTGMKLVDLDGANYDGSGESLGQLILGNDSGNMIVGGVNDDIIIGGKGNDILVGGQGDDLFVWQAGDEGFIGNAATDVIKDFSMVNGVVNGGAGDDILDLRDLFSIDSGKDLSDYLSISKTDAGHAEIKISTAGFLDGGAVDQVIVLENVYSNHSAAGNDDAITELIKQHILTESGN